MGAHKNEAIDIMNEDLTLTDRDRDTVATTPCSGKEEETPCSCGVTSVGGDRHSDWCDLYEVL